MHGHCRPAQRGLVSAVVREVFNATDAAKARRRVGDVIDRLSGNPPKVAELLEAAEDDPLAFFAFPASPRRSCGRRTRSSVLVPSRPPR